jgi:alginate O-acetyltransferase complex protein AlgI
MQRTSRQIVELAVTTLLAALVWLCFRQCPIEFTKSQFLGFCALTLGVYWAVPWHRGKLVWLLAVSIAFYMTWHPRLIALIGASAVADFSIALLMERTRSPLLRRCLLFGSIALSLGLLGYFKYTNFLLSEANSLLALVGIDYHWKLFDNLLLPLGISFYTFETISYVVDVYRGRSKAVGNLVDYSIFLMFFPHLAAGPIVRPRDFLPQLERRKRFSWYRLTIGLTLCMIGLFKKAVIADNLAGVVDPVFADADRYASGAVWLATLGYALQIYCDFSGYSDMAIGLAHTLGFKLPANFNMPYLAVNITDFWRRWHISLSSWLRDYLYVPLGGNRHGNVATYRNLMLTMLLGGLWHGAGWTFVFWGAYHGLLLSIHRIWQRRSRMEDRGSNNQTDDSPSSIHQLRSSLNIALTFLCVCLGWVFFRAQTFAIAWTMVRHLALPTSGAHLSLDSALLVYCCFVLVLLGHLFGSTFTLRTIERRLPAPVLGTALGLLVVLVLLLIPESSKGFIYFRF